MPKPTTFVLVHGSGHGGWCWRDVARRLRVKGSEVFAPTLSGVGDRSHLAGPDIDLETHVSDVANLLFYEDLRHVVLVGHSYGGMVITAVAARVPERIGMLVYLDAYIPDPGQCQFDLWPPEMRDEMESGEAASTGLRPPPTPVQMGISDPSLAEWAACRFTAHPLGTYRQAVSVGDAQDGAMPRAFIRCTRGPMTSLLEPSADKARAARWAFREIEAGHDAMLTAPSDVADVLLELAESAE